MPAPTSFVLARRYIYSATLPAAIFTWESDAASSFLLQGLTADGEVVTSLTLSKSLRKQTVFLRKRTGTVWKELINWRIQSRVGTTLSAWTTLDLSEWWEEGVFQYEAYRGTPTVESMTLWVSDTSLISYLQVDWKDGASLGGISVTLDGKAVVLKNVDPTDENVVYQITDRTQARQILVGQIVDVTVTEVTDQNEWSFQRKTYSLPVVAQDYPNLIPAQLPNLLEDVPGSVTIPFTGTDVVLSATGLPAGMTIDSATGIISGTPTTPGLYSFTVEFSSLIWDRSAVYTLRIVDTPELRSKAFSAVIGEAFSGQAESEGPATTSWAVSAGSSLPPGLSINASTGLITGSPTLSAGITPGAVSTTLEATLDTYGLKSASQAFTVRQYRAPVATAASTASMVAGFEFSIPLSVAAESGDYYLLRDSAVQFTLTSGHSWARIEQRGSKTASLVGTAPTSAGSYPLTVTARNIDGTGAVKTITATVTLPAVPSISDKSTTAKIGSAFSASFPTVAGGVWTWADVPQGCTVSNNSISGTLDASQIYIVKATVRNAAGSDTATLTINVLQNYNISLYPPPSDEDGYIFYPAQTNQILAIADPGYQVDGWSLVGQGNYYTTDVDKIDSSSAMIQLTSYSENSTYDYSQVGSRQITVTGRLADNGGVISRTFMTKHVRRPVIQWNANYYYGQYTRAVWPEDVPFRYTFSASGSPTAWTLGTESEDFAISSTGVLTGMISTPGMFSLTIQAENQWGKSDAISFLLEIAPRTGGIYGVPPSGLLTNHHEYTDLQVDVRKRTVLSSAAKFPPNSASASSANTDTAVSASEQFIAFKHGDDATLAIILIDGEASISSVGSIRVGIMEEKKWFDDVLLELTLDPATVELGGEGDVAPPHFLISCKISSAALDDAIDAMPETSDVLLCNGEVEWVSESGLTHTSATFPVRIYRDVLS